MTQFATRPQTSLPPSPFSSQHSLPWDGGSNLVFATITTCVLICLIYVLLLWCRMVCTRCILGRHNTVYVDPEAPPSPTVLDVAVVSKPLSPRSIQGIDLNDHDDDSDDDCPICYESLRNYHEDDTITIFKSVRLPCRHAFHQKCIQAWFDMGRQTCPYCKQIIKT